MATFRDSGNAQVQSSTIISNRVLAPLMPHSTKRRCRARRRRSRSTTAADGRGGRRFGGAYLHGAHVPDEPSNVAVSDARAGSAHAGVAASASRGTGRSRIRQ
jgi:hypothetical protein